MTIVDQQLESGRAAVAKQKNDAGERVLVEAGAAQSGEPINALTKIDRRIGEHDLELWRELDHGLGTKKAQAEGFELSRVGRGQMQRQARAVGTLEEQAGGRVGHGSMARHKVGGIEL